MIESITESYGDNRFSEYERIPVAQSIFTNAPVGIMITDASCRIIDVNPACIALTGYTKNEILGSNPCMFSSDNNKESLYSEMWMSLRENDYWEGQVCNRKKSGELYSEKICIESIRDTSNTIVNYVAVFSDISYLKKHRDAVKKMAHHDAVTGLPNRLMLAERIKDALANANQDEKLVAICYLDLDGFKRINDSYGHKRGDKVLVEVALRLLQAVRAGDTVACPGGDEFVLMMPDISNINELEDLLGNVLRCLSKPYTLQGISIDVSASIGVAVYPLDESEPDTLMRHADQAMYEAKREGKNRIHFFDPLEEKKISGIQELHNEIRQGLQDNQFVLHYQPKINMRTGVVIGVEALLRWVHPEKGLLYPGDFLPAIEHSNLIVDIGNWVLREAMQQIRRWGQEGTYLKISVNISALQLQQADFVNNLSLLMAEYEDLPPSSLELEILETAAFKDIDAVREVITGCGELGIEFALDDFGTGYSSLTYLRQLPAEVIKLDRSFVSEMLDDPDDLAIVEGVLSLAKTFHRKPLAEGVETVQHGILLMKIGCFLGQGFAIARPMPGDEIPAWKKHYKVPDAWKNAEIGNNIDLKFSILNMAVKHHSTVNRALSAIEQRVPALLPKYIHDYRNCEFGQWLESECREYFGDIPAFKQVTLKHKHIFEMIKQAVDLLKEGDEKSLKTVVQAIKKTRSELLDILNELQNNRQLLKEAI